MDEINELIELRKKKLNELKQLNLDPYNQKFEAKHTVKELFDKYGHLDAEQIKTENIECAAAGRIVSYRNFGKAAFCHIQDGYGGKIQAYLSKQFLKDDYSILKKADIGDIIGIEGILFRTKTNELTIEALNFKLLSKALHPLPEKWHGLTDVEIRYRQRYLDLIVNPQVRETFAVRSKIIKAMRDFFEERDFIEVETPMMHAIPGGAAAKPFKTHHNALGIDLYLRIAPELYLKRLLVGGYDRIFEINKNFRNEGISTKHNPEFTMLEFYIAYKDYNFLMEFTEELFQYVAQKTLNTLTINYADQIINLTPPWKRISFTEALQNKGAPKEVISDYQFALKWVKDRHIKADEGASHSNILDEIFKELVEPELIQPTFIYDYPVELSPLAKRKAQEPDLTERFELFIMGREIANAFSELNDPQDQMERFQKQAQAREKGDEDAHPMDYDFIKALEHAMPPAAGEGIGIDRLVMLLTNSPSIRDVILFPQLKPEIQ
ncbi:lysyl-tRNA synthetase [Candidatus Magnetoovum chiemensis]|nr:lysyl-tRNA synthetase [Candidatus Magnetoovum chiemensis]